MKQLLIDLIALVMLLTAILLLMAMPSIIEWLITQIGYIPTLLTVWLIPVIIIIRSLNK